MNIIYYWLGEDSILLCDIYDSLAQYCNKKENNKDYINYMKQALTIVIRAAGLYGQRVGERYYCLA
jgi:hypothetical protein